MTTITKNILCALLLAWILAGCAASTKLGGTLDEINRELKRATTERAPGARPEAVDRALLPPLQGTMSRPVQPRIEPRFDLIVNNAPASQVFLAIVSGTRYNMLLHPDTAGTISVNLKDVTVSEALEAIREIYGYEYKMQGTRIYIQPLTIQTRVFQVNYLAGRRQGSSDVRVSSGSISSAGTTGGTNAAPGSVPVTGTSGNGGSTGPGQRAPDSSRIFTTSDSDFWTDLTAALKTIVGSEGGRQVIVNSMSGVIVVRALPGEQRSVENFLRATQLIVERQVMLEAKIINVTLKDGYESGINWSVFRNNRLSAGMLNRGTVLQRDGELATRVETLDSASRTFTNPMISAIPGTELTGGTNGTNGIFGLAFRASNFAALLTFLETQGTVHVLSSPRIATINNQKAVLKVGTDEFFVTSVTTTTTTGTVGTNTVSPTITVQPFFSGIALDVTPQIDEENNIILHIHPSVSEVAEKTKLLDLGTLGTFKLPLATSDINETDSIVRVQDGNIVAIGGLMKRQDKNDSSGLPGTSDVPVAGTLFNNKIRSSLKSELVILLKPTLIHDDRNWVQDLSETQHRVEEMGRRTVTVTPEGTRVENRDPVKQSPQ